MTELWKSEMSSQESYFFFLDSSTGSFASVRKGPKMYRQGRQVSVPGTLEGQCCFV